ncbi:hypothetical protein [Jiangella mangrovi]|uniref:Uncharacterized protein n=1 Tax=Jiangella mangrovi TaxID=1524084 RepID=A0A7W9GLB5_9ACTN|nr:hypothetical protein [Jiangella mangrovi]MBB5785989.1 hypothetical protein [Jiangella mangrovi]
MTTTFATILTSGNPALKRALDDIPHYTETKAAVAAAKAALNAESARRPAAQDDLVSEVMEVLRAGEEVPTDLAERAHAATLAPQQRKAVIELLDQAHRRLDEELDTVIRGGADAVFGSLHDQLQDVITRFEKLEPRVLDVASPSGAITAGLADAWQEAQLVGKDYAAIREAQQLATHAFNTAGDRPWTEQHFAIENLDEVWPEWFVYRGVGVMVDVRTREQHRIVPPMPAEPGLAYLAWAREAGAILWVPTLRQLRETYAASNTEAGARWYGKKSTAFTIERAQKPGTEPALLPGDADLPDRDGAATRVVTL